MYSTPFQMQDTVLVCLILLGYQVLLKKNIPIPFKLSSEMNTSSDSSLEVDLPTLNNKQNSPWVYSIAR